MIKKVMLSAVLCSTLAACQQGPGFGNGYGYGNSGGSGNSLFTKENIGTVGGAVGGAWIGSNVGKGKGNIAAIAAGTLLGAALGNSIGASLDRADLNYQNNAAQRALETGQSGAPVVWQNPDSGISGTVIPSQAYQQNGTYCREFRQTINVGGRVEEGFGTACRQQDGTWRIVQ